MPAHDPPGSCSRQRRRFYLPPTFGARDNDDAHDPWRVMIGGGIVARPEFPGSDSIELLPLPMFDLTYDDRWFLNRDGLGAYIVNDARWQLSVSVAADLAQRDESDAEHLRGTGDVGRTAVAALEGGYRIGPIQAVLGIDSYFMANAAVLYRF